jgi:hypothetical protein
MKAAACLALCVLVAGAARARENGNGNGALHVGGQLRAAFEDYQIDLPGGTTHHSLLTQTYAADMRGPLFLPGLGTVSGAVTSSTGDNLSRLIEGQPSSDKTLGTTLSANLIPDQLDGLVSVMPFVGRQEHTLAGGASSQSEVETMLGGSAGVGFPALPSVSVEVRKTGRVETGYAAPNNTDSLSTHVRAGYVRGPVRLEFDRQGWATTEAKTGLRQVDQTALRTNGTLDLPDVKRHGIQGVSAQAAFTDSTVLTPVPVATRALSAATRATTQSVRVAGVTNYAAYGPSYNGDLVKGRHFVGHDLGFFSHAASPLWNISNQVQATNAPGRMTQTNALSDQLSTEALTPNRKWGSRAQGSESYRWGGPAPAAMSDGLSHRLSWYPGRSLDAWLDQGYNASRQPGLGTMSRGFGAGAGINWRPLSRLEIGPSVERAWIRDFAGGHNGVRDTVSLSARSTPIDDLTVGVTGRLEVSNASGATSSTDRYSNVGLDATWRPVTSLDVSGRVTRYDRSVGTPGAVRAGAFETSGSVGYRIGRTTASVGWETRKLTMPNAYRHLTASLTRAF